MICTLSRGGASAAADTLGGMMTAYRLPDGRLGLWTGDAAYWAGHSPLLFPVVGAMRQAQMRAGGRTYAMEKHGFARRLEYVPAEADAVHAVFVLDSSEETRRFYPYAFRVTSTHRLLDGGFSTEFRVDNRGAEPMPFCIGGHPGFCCPMRTGEAFDDYEVGFDAPEDPALLFTDAGGILHPGDARVLLQHNALPLAYALFDQDVLIVPALRSRTVSLRSRRTGRGLCMTVHGFSSLGIWTPPHRGAPFVCLEPWQGLPAWADDSGELAAKPGAVVLAPGESYTCGFAVRWD